MIVRWILIALIVFTEAQWREKILIKEKARGAMAVYGDHANGISHLLYNDRKGVYYSTVGPDMQKGKEIQFEDVEQMIPQGSIIGHPNGKSLYATFTARRRGNESRYEIYFSESMDYGATWTKPIPVPRPNLTDKMDRLGPTLIKSPVNDRLWIFYNCWNLVCVVTRPQGSSVFSNEEVVKGAFSNGSAEQVQVSYTLNGSQVILHLLYKNSIKQSLNYMHSDDNGITWSNEKFIARAKSGDIEGFSDYSLITLPYNKPVEAYIAYPDYEIHKMVMKRSLDHGNKWSLPFAIQESPFVLRFPLLNICPHLAQYLFILSYPDKEAPSEFGAYDLNINAYKSRTTPYLESVIEDAASSCVETAKEASYIGLLAVLDHSLYFLRTNAS